MKKFLIVLASAAMTLSAAAQTLPLTESSTSDVQGRFRAGLTVPIGKSVNVQWSEQLRLGDNFGSVEKVVSSLGVDYKPLPFLKLGAEYCFVNEHDAVEGWDIRHRLNLDVAGSYRAGRVKLSLRERVRLRFRSDSVNRFEKPDPFVTLRSRVKAAYDIRHSRWEPYAYAELYVTLNAPAPVGNFKTDAFSHDNYINRVRLAVGTEYKIDNRNRLDFYYMVHFNREFRARYKAGSGDMKEWSLAKQCNHVFGIDYNFKL